MNVQQIKNIAALMRRVRKELDLDPIGTDLIILKFEELAQEIEYQGVGLITQASLEGAD